VCEAVNTHNCRVRGSENSLDVTEHERDSPVIVRSILMKNDVIGLFFFFFFLKNVR
jgi:hypothetical protein